MDIHQHELKVRDLPAQTVTLYPTRAHIVRTIEDVSLKPGVNEITIYGITPTADESSIKFEGVGSAIITDLTIDLVENHELFEDAYPSDPEDIEESEDDTPSDSDTEPQTIKSLNTRLQELEMSAKNATEQRNSAQGCLNMLDNYSRSLTTSRPDDIEACVAAYQKVRMESFENHRGGEATLKQLDLQMSKIKAEKRKIQLKIRKEEAKARRARTKEREKKDRENQQKTAEKKRVEHERMQFWPKKAYKVVLSLDAPSGMTPASSRRGSIDSTTKSAETTTKAAQDGSDVDTSMIKLSFSYVVHSASWSPRYDLALDTVSKSGSITYRAEFRNTTSETWRNAKVILSTSQTSFQGLGGEIPKIQPWHLRLAKGFGDHVGNIDQALYSQHEHNPHIRSRGLFGQKPQHSRSALFGANNAGTGSPFGAQQRSVFGAQQAVPPPPATQLGSSGLFGAPLQATSSGFGAASGAGGGLFGAPNPNNRGGSLFGSLGTQNPGVIEVQPNIAAPPQRQAPQPVADEEEHDIDDQTLAPTPGALAFEESIWEESGLTATYAVPGTKTIAPSHTTRRHKVASIPLSSVTLSYMIVPKLRSAAFLKARLRNGSSITLLKGLCGITLDGSFLGNITLPRSSPGEAFLLNLGIDPAINVVYAKPTVRRSESGVFQKEASAIYTRTCTLTNTKNDAAISATVIDQAPVSEDEKLKIEILVPKGLDKESGQAVKAGVGQINEGTGKKGSTYAEDSTAGSSSGGKWGKATAKLKKGGEIEWDVQLKAGQGVKLELEYIAKFPSGTGVMGSVHES
ncbi:MAG: hypothetical protein Q9168_006573 [Polycauliona sp. 1 TL-2023]